MDKYIAVYLFDIKRAIDEVESFLLITRCVMRFLKTTICAEVPLNVKRK